MDIFIEEKVSKEPYLKDITIDKIINITGESGSGKSTFTNKYLSDDNYIVIDTDEIIGDRPTNNKNCVDIRKFLIDKYGDNIPNLCEDFDTIYKDILDYYKNTDKFLVIDSAQFRNTKDLSILKGKIIIIRTSIDLCYERCLERYSKLYPDATEEEKYNYANRKKRIYDWYPKLNEFIKRIDDL